MITTTATKLLSPKQAASVCNVDKMSIHRWVKYGRHGFRLRSKPEGHRVYISPADLDEFLAKSNAVGDIEADYSRLS